MHKAQVYFDDDLFECIKEIAKSSNTSISAYVRSVMEKEVKKKQQNHYDLFQYSGLWQDYDIDQNKLRAKAWK